MRLHVVSDVHGNVEALARAGSGCDGLLVLGDLIDFVDYADPAGGILGHVLGPEVSAEFARLRRDGAPGELAAYNRRVWSVFGDPAGVIEEAVHAQYARLFAVMPEPTWAIPGNVDLPDLWPAHLRPGIRVPDGEVVEIDGLRFGFVGGVPLPPGVPRRTGGPWRPHLVPDGEYRAAVEGLADGGPPLDVLCSHAPPALPDVAFDVVSGRRELAGRVLCELILRERPRAALHGHVHQPLAPRARVGRTECVNVGYFRRTGEPYVLQW